MNGANVGSRIEKRPFKFAGANVRYPIAKRSLNNSDKIDGS